ncbi:MAG: F0F1 ATP synthase subunit B [Rhodospirillaceae bacterium]|nr:F0F1 ATP synthase subunit B [Rhodospirillaceae bacterium]|tara:strand:+ start:1147 stop:1626 length:480 start_codon:yes stop_codon:yes gene_type:complete
MNLDPTAWVAVSFFLFVLAVFRPAKKAILSGLDKKIDQIKAEIEEAQELREEAEALLASYHRKQREALQEAEAIVSRAQDDATRLRREAEGSIEAALKRQEELATEKISQLEAAAISRIRNTAVEIAMDATEKVLGDRLTGKKGKELAENSIAELGKRF